MPGIGEGIASGLTNALQLALQSKSQDIRQERNEALQNIGASRANIAQGTLDLKRDIEAKTFRPSVSEQQAEFEANQEAVNVQRAGDKLELEQAQEADRKTKSFLDASGHLDRMVGDNRTPAQEEAFSTMLDSFLAGRGRAGGLYSEADVAEFVQGAFDPKNPIPGAAEAFQNFYLAGVTQADNQVETMQADLDKMIEKNPMLGTNPEALKADEKASALSQAVGELTQTSDQFKSHAAEADQFTIDSKEREEAERDERNRQRAEAIEAIQAERTKVTGRVSPSVKFAEELAKGTTEGKQFAERMLEFKRAEPFSTAFDKKAGQEAGELKVDLEGQIVRANESIRTIDRAVGLLDSKSGVFSGPLANIKTNFNKYLKEVGVDLAGEKIANTEAFAAIMARDVLNILGSGALGAGTGISDNDRLFAARIAGGDITLDEQSIRKLLDVNKRVNNAKITIAGRRLDVLRTQREAGDPFAGTSAETIDRIEGGGLNADAFEQKYFGGGGQ